MGRYGDLCNNSMLLQRSDQQRDAADGDDEHGSLEHQMGDHAHDWVYDPYEKKGASHQRALDQQKQR